MLTQFKKNLALQVPLGTGYKFGNENQIYSRIMLHRFHGIRKNSDLRHSNLIIGNEILERKTKYEIRNKKLTNKKIKRTKFIIGF